MTQAAKIIPLDRAPRDYGSRVLRQFMDQRARERSEQAVIVPPQRRTYEGAVVDRLTQDWVPHTTPINVDIERALPMLRGRSRHMWQNTAFGRRFAKLVRNNVVGPNGFAFSCAAETAGQLDDPVNAAVEKAFAKWSKKKHCDHAERLSFAAMCQLIATQVARDGEALVRKIRGPKAGAFGYQLQILNPDRVDLNYNAPLRNGNQVRMGVEVEPSGRIVALYVLSHAPGETRITPGQAVRERVPAGDIRLVFLQEDAEQIRGVPWAHAVLLDMRMEHGFSEAAVIAARAAASKFGWIKQTEGGENTQPLDLKEAQQKGLIHMDFSPMSIGSLPYGWDFDAFDSKYPDAAFDPFINAISHKLASGLDVAHHSLTGRMDKVTYSSARIAELGERDSWRTIQNWLIDDLLLEVGEEWLAMSLLTGQIRTDNGRRVGPDELMRLSESIAFDGRGWDWVDPKNEVGANVEAIDNNLDSLTSVARRQGKDITKIIKERAREKALLEAAGLSAKVQTSAPPSGEGQSDGDGEGNQDTGDQSSIQGRSTSDIKLIADAYGVGVRAGVVTPQSDDETYFRGLMHLPAATADVIEDWKASPIRRPITVTPDDAGDDSSVRTASDNEADTGTSTPATEDPTDPEAADPANPEEKPE